MDITPAQWALCVWGMPLATLISLLGMVIVARSLSYAWKRRSAPDILLAIVFALSVVGSIPGILMAFLLVLRRL